MAKVIGLAAHQRISGRSAESHNDSTAESENLRRIIETQPGCLIRVALDGTLYAINEAGLALFGSASLGDVLEQKITQHIAASVAQWDEFAARVWERGSGSFECGLTRGDRTVLLSAVALRDHPDRVESLIAALRETSAVHRLEQALEHASPDPAEIDALRTAVAGATAEKQQLTAKLNTVSEEITFLQQLTDQQQHVLIERDRRNAALSAELAQSTAERERLAATLQEIDGKTRSLDVESSTLRAALGEARSDRDGAIAESARLTEAVASVRGELSTLADERTRLERLLRESEAERQRIAAEYSAEQTRLESALHAAHEQVNRRTSDEKSAVADLELMLARAREEGACLTALVAERDDMLRRLTAALADAERAASAEREESARRLSDRQQLIEELQTQAASGRAAHEPALAAARAEQQRLTELVAWRDEDLRQLGAALADVERAGVSERDDLTQRLAGERQLVADLQARVAALTSELDRLGGATAERDELTRHLAEERQLVVELQSRVAVLTSELDRLGGVATDRDEELTLARTARTAAERALADIERAAGAERDELTLRLAKERELVGELQAHVASLTTELDRVGEVAAGRAAELTSLRTAYEEKGRALAARNDETTARLARSEETITALEGQMAALLAERDRISTLVSEHGSRATEETAARAAAEERLRAVEIELAQARADARTETSRLAALVRDSEEQAAEETAARAAGEQRLKALEIELAQARADALAETNRLAALVREREDRAAEENAARAAVEERLHAIEIALAKARADARTETGQLAAAVREREAERDSYRAALAAERDERERHRHDSQRDAAIVAQHGQERDRLLAEREAAASELARLHKAHEQTMVADRLEYRKALASMQAELALAIAEQKRAQADAARARRDRDRLAAVHAAGREELDRVSGSAVRRTDVLVKEVANVKLELDQVQTLARALEPLAMRGRLARTVGHELHQAAAAVRQRVMQLLRAASLDAAERPELESLQADAIRLLSLARMLEQAAGSDEATARASEGGGGREADATKSPIKAGE